MKIKYQFLKGGNTEINMEVSTEIEDFLTNSDKYIHASNERQRTHCYSLECGEENGFQYAGVSNIDELFKEPSYKEQLLTAIEMLKPKERELIEAIYFEGISVKDYAATKGVVASAISNRLRRCEKKLKNFCKKREFDY